MSEVHVKEGESLDSALKRFKRSCAKAGVLAEVRKRECYESPSVKRRKKSEAARQVEKIAKALDGMQIVKVIFVKNKLINLIVKPQ